MAVVVVVVVGLAWVFIVECVVVFMFIAMVMFILPPFPISARRGFEVVAEVAVEVLDTWG